MSDAPSVDRIRAAKRVHEDAWLRVPGVVAVGIGVLADGRNGIIVSVASAADRERARIPDDVDGVPVEVCVTGLPRALSD